MENNIFKEYFEVRDNEIDIQGIVNNPNYMIYLGHARHKFIEKIGINFTEYAKNGLNLVIASCGLSFKHSLRPYDRFYVTCEIKPTDSKVKFSFYQEIRLVEGDKLVLTADFIATCINEKATNRAERIFIPEELKKLYAVSMS